MFTHLGVGEFKDGAPLPKKKKTGCEEEERKIDFKVTCVQNDIPGREGRIEEMVIGMIIMGILNFFCSNNFYIF